MPDQKLSALAELSIPALEDLLYTVDDPSGTPVSAKLTTQRLLGLLTGSINGFRLTLTAGLPVTTADVTGATTIYCSPYISNRIALYDGTRWVVRSSAEFSLALGTLTGALPYDIFAYDNAGVPTLEFLAWSSATARATALTRQDGVLVKTGDPTRRYLGTFYTASTTTTEDSLARRLLWNADHRVRRPMQVLEATDSWSANLNGVWRYANNSVANRLEVVIGWAEEAIDIRVSAFGAAGVTSRRAGIGEDTNTAITTGCLTGHALDEGPAIAFLTKIPAVGFHYYGWLESTASGTPTFYGDAGNAALHQSGIVALTWA